MSNTQSIDSLRELNAKLLAEITELRKENTEIPKLREKFAEVEAENAELRKMNTVISDLRNKLSVFDAEIAELKQKNTEALRADNWRKEYIERRDVFPEGSVGIMKLEHESAELEGRLTVLEKNIELRSRVVKLEQDIVELKKELEPKKNRKFQEKCILIAQVLLGEEPIVEYRPPFLNGLELDAFFQKYRIALEVQGAQHRLHSTSWYKDVKKLEDIVNRDWRKRCICQDNGISLLEIWYDEKPEIVIPERIRKIKEFVCLASKSSDLLYPQV